MNLCNPPAVIPVVFSLGSRAGSTVAGASTRYITFAAVAMVNGTNGPDFSTTESERQMIIPVSGTLRNLFVRTNTAQPAGGGSLTLTVRINGVDTGITVTIPSGTAAGTLFNVTNSAAVVAGNLISMKGVNTHADTASAALIQWAITLA